jgi:hypothetical protein
LAADHTWRFERSLKDTGSVYVGPGTITEELGA